MTVSTVGRRVRRWQEVHDRLYDAAAALFLDHGFANTSVDAIAERADVARKTAFNHFPRKRDFIAEWGVRRRRRVESVLPAGRRDQPTSLRIWFDELAKINIEGRALTRRMLEGWRHSGGPFDEDAGALAQVFTGLVADGRDDGRFPDHVDPARVGTLLYSAYFGTLYDWAEGTDAEAPFDLRESFRFVVDTVLSGITTEGG